MKSIFIKAYCVRNLGDDLFLLILSERYAERFIAIANPKYNYNRDFKNIKFNRSIIRYYTMRVLERLLKRRDLLERSAIKKSDLLISIGGSIFIENTSSNIEEEYKIYDTDRDYYIVGSNFGPYYTKKYIDFIRRRVFERAKDVCFRDSYSYSLFEDLKNVRKASDIVLSLKLDDYKIENSKRVIISVINCKEKGIPEFESQYENIIINLIKHFDDLDYKVVLMSFCKKEGDELTVQRLLEKTKNLTLKSSVDSYYYRDNLREALEVLGNSSVVVGSRFHANILGLLMNKTIIPIAYSDKTINTLKDIGYTKLLIDIRKSIQIEDVLNSIDLSYKIDIDKFRKDAIGHFKELDRHLEKK